MQLTYKALGGGTRGKDIRDKRVPSKTLHFLQEHVRRARVVPGSALKYTATGLGAQRQVWPPYPNVMCVQGESMSPMLSPQVIMAWLQRYGPPGSALPGTVLRELAELLAVELREVEATVLITRVEAHVRGRWHSDALSVPQGVPC